MRRATAIGFLLLSFGSAHASNLGEPLAVEDWAVVDSAYSLERALPPGECSDPPLTRCIGNGTSAVDATGAYITVVRTPNGACNGYPMFLSQIVRCVGGLEGCAVIAQVADRPCSDATKLEAVWTDNTDGFLYVRMLSWEPTGQVDRYPDIVEVLRVRGFATLHEILLEFTPDANTMSFAVPLMPEGFSSAESFTAYTGILANPIDFSAATVIGSAVTGQAGDHVETPLPPGSGRFFVVAASHLGQTRYGRKTANGVTSGRDPNLLPPARPEWPD